MYRNVTPSLSAFQDTARGVHRALLSSSTEVLDPFYAFVCVCVCVCVLHR